MGRTVKLEKMQGLGESDTRLCGVYERPSQLSCGPTSLHADLTSFRRCRTWPKTRSFVSIPGLVGSALDFLASHALPSAHFSSSWCDMCCSRFADCITIVPHKQEEAPLPDSSTPSRLCPKCNGRRGFAVHRQVSWHHTRWSCPVCSSRWLREKHNPSQESLWSV